MLEIIQFCILFFGMYVVEVISMIKYSLIKCYSFIYSKTKNYLLK